jgi:hypothetical protein
MLPLLRTAVVLIWVLPCAERVPLLLTDVVLMRVWLAAPLLLMVPLLLSMPLAVGYHSKLTHPLHLKLTHPLLAIIRKKIRPIASKLTF